MSKQPETYKGFVNSVMDKVVSAGLVDTLRALITEQMESDSPQVTVDGEYEDWYITSDPELTTVWQKYEIHPDQPELFVLDEALTQELGIPIYKATLSDLREYS